MMSKILALAFVASAAATVELNGADFDAAIAGKGVRSRCPCSCVVPSQALSPVPQAINFAGTPKISHGFVEICRLNNALL
jgi:hypothetical protein